MLHTPIMVLTTSVVQSTGTLARLSIGRAYTPLHFAPQRPPMTAILFFGSARSFMFSHLLPPPFVEEAGVGGASPDRQLRPVPPTLSLPHKGGRECCWSGHAFRRQPLTIRWRHARHVGQQPLLVLAVARCATADRSATTNTRLPAPTRGSPPPCQCAALRRRASHSLVSRVSTPGAPSVPSSVPWCRAGATA